MSYRPQYWVSSLFAGTQQRRGAASEAKGEKSREQTRIFLMNWFDNRLDDTLHDIDMNCIALVVPDPHESPRLLLKVPARLDDPAVIVVLFAFSSCLYISSCANIVPDIMIGSGTSRTHAPLPLIMPHSQDVIKPISTASFKNVKREVRFCMEIRLSRVS
jgi:hypothetical protein